MFDKGEGMSIGDIRKHQEKMLRDVVRYAYDNVPLYREKFKSAGITPEDIRSLDDLEKIPFTTKNNLRAAYPYGLLAVGIDRVVRFHASSGTTGKPTVVPFTSNDIEVQSLLMARSLSTATVTKDDIVQNAYTYGLFTGGLMFHYGAEKLGAAVIPSATGNTRRQIEIMRDMRTTVLCCTPSYTMRIKEVANEMGLEPSKDFSLRVGVFGAEPWSEGM
ncbi:MAG: phenylacetate--CoA ligase, partial [Thermoplasmata archaeon]